MDWKKELEHMVTVGCSDSSIKDYVESHPEINGKEIWDYVYEHDAPSRCKGCKHIQMRGMFPCNNCKRNKVLEDYYESR